jgi:hypothetical protein
MAGELGVTAMLESVGVLGVPGVPVLPFPPVLVEPPVLAELAVPEPQPASEIIRNEAAHKRIQLDPTDLFTMREHHRELRRTATYDGEFFQNVGPEFLGSFASCMTLSRAHATQRHTPL